jgi:hypothetical protein
MKWYWWVLIVVGLTAIGYLKLKIWNRMKANRAKKRAEQEEE